MKIVVNDSKFVMKIPTEIYSRIVGYYRPVQNWHAGKQQEFKDRAMYSIPKDVIHESTANGLAGRKAETG